jgi:hypothetical protein
VSAFVVATLDGVERQLPTLRRSGAVGAFLCRQRRLRAHGGCRYHRADEEGCEIGGRAYVFAFT